MRALVSRIAHALTTGRLRLIDDSGDVQLVQTDEGPSGVDGARKLLNQVPRVTEFGFASNPPPGSEVVMARVAGNRSLALVTSTGHRASRPRNLPEGDATLYDVRGARIWASSTGIVIDGADTGLPITIKGATLVRIEADSVEITGDLVTRADGARVSVNGLRDAYAGHHHGDVEPGSASTGTTDAPA